MANGDQGKKWFEIEPGDPKVNLFNIDESEIGCQVNLITGKHYGPCRGSCKEETVSRITRDEMLLRKSELSALRGTCTRASIGATVSRDGRTISEGYVGSPPGLPHCIEMGCIVEDDHYVRTTHAEMNALLFAARNGISTYGAELHTTHSPCLICAKAIITAGIQRVVWAENRNDVEATKNLLGRAGVRYATYRL